MCKNVFILILPGLMLMTGCGSGGYAADEQENGQHIYIHTDDGTDFAENMWMMNEMRRQNTQDFINSTNRTLDDMDGSIRRMNRTNMGTLGILEGARRQQELYNQQRRQDMHNAYPH